MAGPRLAGQTAIVTGSTAGLGAAIARLFAAEGARVVVTGRDGTRGADVVRTITADGGTAAFVAADLVDDAAPAALVAETLRRFGRLTILVNNAVDAAGDAALGTIEAAAWTRILHLNLTAPARLIAAALPYLGHGGGAIVNIASRAAERGTPGLAAYTASKGGLLALTRQVAVDYAAAGVRCNSVTPGYILHETRDRVMDPAKRRRVEGQHLTRLATARDVALAVLFLAGPEAETITGIDLPVSGGSTTARALRFG